MKYNTEMIQIINRAMKLASEQTHREVYDALATVRDELNYAVVAYGIINE